MTSRSSSKLTWYCSPYPPLSHEIIMPYMSSFHYFQQDKLLFYSNLCHKWTNVFYLKKIKRCREKKETVQKRMRAKETFLFSET